MSDVPIPNTDVYTFMFGDLKGVTSRTALIDGVSGNEVTYADLVSTIEKVSSALYKLGVNKGSVLAVVSPNCVEYPVIFFAAQKLGAIITTLNPSFTASDLEQQLLDCGAEWIFTFPTLIETVEAATKKINKIQEIILFGNHNGTKRSFTELVNYPLNDLPSVSFNPKEDVAALPYSSGTTGLPKGVLITHANIVAAVTFFANQVKIAPEKYLVYLPMFHVYGMVCLMITALKCRKTIVVLQRFKPEEFCSTIERYKIDTVFGVPPTMLFLAKSNIPDMYDMSSLKHIHSGAAPLGQGTEIELAKKYGVQFSQSWGMTELCGVGTIPEENNNKAGSIGRAFQGLQIKIANPETGLQCKTGEQGELWIRGPNVMKGYHNNPKGMEDIFVDGWLRSGDIGYKDQDEYIFITDRMKEIFKHKGFQVAPAELESVLLTLEDVADAAVIGVPDAYAGEIPKAFIVVKPGHTITTDHIITHVQENCARHKWLKGGVTFLDAIPKSPSGKILRKELRKFNET